MSGGQQQMLAIGRALVDDPDLLLVDELDGEAVGDRDQLEQYLVV